MTLTLNTANTNYDIVIKAGCTRFLNDSPDLDRKVLIVTDSGVPETYSARVAAYCKEPISVCVAAGEASKSIAVWEDLLLRMMNAGFTRADCVVAVGGGVVGDLAGFVAATYMRGIDFYNVPTTLLAQVDASVGGKVALDLNGCKNAVGAFYQPKKVWIDPELLQTLPPRQVANGLAEAIKTALIRDAELFALLETRELPEILSTVIERSVRIKKEVVEADEKEAGLRKILNFGHTLGHGIESTVPDLYHGECVALGMLPMCEGAVRERLRSVLRKFDLPTVCEFDTDAVMGAVLHDKKKNADGTVTVVTVDKIGSCQLHAAHETELRLRLDTLRG